MPQINVEIQVLEPLSPLEIRHEIERRGDSIASLARDWKTNRQQLSALINRHPHYVSPRLRALLAEYLNVEVSQVGNEPARQPDEAKAA
ncbi:MAG: hypothetical protein ACR2LC_09505 [Pyrinomonadaceae bacterium]